MRRSRPFRAGLIAAAAACLGVAASATVPAGATPADPGATPAPGTYTAVPPARVLDTRSHLGGSEPAAGHAVAVRVTGVGGVPASGVGAVALNVTAVVPRAAGYLTVYPAGSARPTASSLNFAAGRTVANLVLAKVGTNGEIDVYNGSSAAADVVVDVSGYYADGAASEAGAFTPLAPARILDTRRKLGGSAPAAHGQVTLTVAGAGGVPAGIGAVALNVTVTGATAGGSITAYPDDGNARPVASNVNFAAGSTVADTVVVSVPASGRIALYNGSGRPVQLIADVAGYFLPGQARTPGTLHATAPSRAFDTRAGVPEQPELKAGGVLAFKTAGVLTVPPSGVSSVLLTVTVTAPQTSGYLTVYAGGSARPTVSNVNFRAGQTIANLVLAPIGANGVIDFYNGSAGRTQVIADIEGYYSSVADRWSATEPPLPAGQDSEGLTGVSCVSSDSCTAVGIWNTQSPYAVGPLIETSSNGSWVRLEQPVPHTDIERKLTAVSCVSAASCMAVGFDSPDSASSGLANMRPVVDRLVDGQWTATRLPVPADIDPADFEGASFAGVSCTSATRCVAVGDLTSVSGAFLFIETFDGTSWTATDIPVPGALAAGLSGVSCVSDTSCVAVGTVSAAPPTYTAVIETLADGQWSTDTTLDHASAAKASGWDAVSCPAEGSCVAVSGSGLAATLAGGTWTAGAMPRDLTAVSCAAVGACTAAGSYYSDRAGDSQPLVADLNGGTWTATGLPLPVGHGRALAVSCPGASSCLATGSAVVYKPSSVFVPPLIESELAS